jgi:phage tail-like protein
MALEADRRLAGNFNFVVSLRRSAQAESGASETLAGAQAAASAPPGDLLCDGGFQECSGLEIEMDVQELQEGGRNDGVIRRVGRGKYGNIVLKRGMFYGDDDRVNPALWAWLQGILEGRLPVPRYDGQVKMLHADGITVLATWTFDRGLPQKVQGPSLNAKTGDVAMEELTIAHEGLRLAV